MGDLLLHHPLVQLEAGDAVGEYPTGTRPNLENGHRVAFAGQFFRHHQSGRSGSDHRDPLAGRSGPFRHRVAVLATLEVGGKGLKLSNRHRLPALAHDAGPLTQPLLRTDATADLRQVASLAEDLCGSDEILLLDQPEGEGDIVVCRAGFNALGFGALDASGRLDYGGAGIVAQIHLTEVPDAFLHGLLGDRLMGNLHAGLAVDVLRIRSAVPHPTIPSSGMLAG